MISGFVRNFTENLPHVVAKSLEIAEDVYSHVSSGDETGKKMSWSLGVISSAATALVYCGKKINIHPQDILHSTIASVTGVYMSNVINDVIITAQRPSDEVDALGLMVSSAVFLTSSIMLLSANTDNPNPDKADLSYRLGAAAAAATIVVEGANIVNLSSS